jgi:NAD(P)-dependent dehydrogenase (short-subunit alcohol dehydrogenase family)
MVGNERLRGFGLTDKPVIVVGVGGGGIGTEMCRLLASVGAPVIAADIVPDALETARAAVETEGGRCLGVQVDATSEADMTRAVAVGVDEFGPLYGFVNVTGGPTHEFKPALETSAAEFRKNVERNLIAAFVGASAAARQMIAQGTPGSIVVLSSMAGVRPLTGAIAYSASKAGVVNMAQSLAVSLGRHNIRVNVVAPSGIKNPLSAARGQVKNPPFTSIPLGRRGEPSEVPPAVLYFLSPLSSFVTGQHLAIDGGVSPRSPLHAEEDQASGRGLL